MKQMKSFFRKETADLPLSVYYFAASHVDEKPRPLHRERSFLILLMQTGQVHFYTAGRTEVLGPGDILIVPPTTLRAIHTVNIQTRYTILAMLPDLFSFPSSHFFTREFFQPMLQGVLQMPQVLRPGMPGYAEVHAPMQQLDVQKEGTKAYSMELLSAAMAICSALYPQCNIAEDAEKHNWSFSERCLYYIDQHYQQQITLQELAHHVHLHPNYLCTLFREQTGKTVFEQINWVRIHAASKLLRSTQLPISQVAVKCGFQNVNYFSRTFRQHLGQSPTAYRRSSRNIK